MPKDAYYPETDEMDESDSETSDMPEKEQADVETTLVPMSFLGGGEKEVGDVCKVEIVAIHDGEVEIRYKKHDENEESSDSEDGEMDIADSMKRGGMGY